MNPLKPCPQKPNCISTTHADRSRSMLPLAFKGTRAETMAHIRTIVRSLPRTRIEKEDENYLHCTFTSALFGFVDDVEFYLDEKNKMVHFRSASRIGYSDLGANRKRMENFVSLYEKP